MRKKGTLFASILILAGFFLQVSTASSVASTNSWRNPSVLDNGNIFSISPPGENAFVSQSSSESPDATDQATKYANLATGFNEITNPTISNYFYPENLGISKKDIVRTENLNSGTVIYRDVQDIPHIYGETNDDVAFGAGYAAAEDRLFAMDVLRHLGSGTLASFAGASCSFEQMDYDQVSQTSYTPQENTQMVDNLKTEGATGEETFNLIQSFISGINSRISFDNRDSKKFVPIEYKLLGQTPQNFVPGNVISILNVISAQDGEGGGAELQNAALLNFFKNKYGSVNGMKVFNNFKEQNDPATFDTVSKPYPYMDSSTQFNPELNAIPDNPSSPLINQISDLTQGCSDAPKKEVSSEILSIIASSSFFPKQTSNAVIVSSKYSKGGSPIAVFGPQIGYFAPTVLMEEDLHGPNIAAAGVSLAGMNFAILFGRASTFAWSGTSSGADDEDERVEVLCNPNGGQVSSTSTYYIFKGKCLDMTRYDSYDNVQTTLAAPGKSAPLDHIIFKTVHGVVQGWTTLNSKPVAISLQRASNMQEETALLGLVRWMNPKTNSVASWLIGAESCPWALNWYYISAQNISYYSGGLLPIRPKNLNPNLPTYGTGVAEWQGWLPPQDHPQITDPVSGEIINWNNQSAPMFSAADNDYSHGPVYRSDLLQNSLNQVLQENSNKLSEANVIKAVEQAGLTDMSFTSLFPTIDRLISTSTDSKIKSLLSLLKTWYADGGMRVLQTGNNGSINNLPGPSGGLSKTSQYQNASAIVIWDQFYPQLVTAIFNGVFSGSQINYYKGLPISYSILSQEFAATPNGDGTNQGDSYGAGWEGYVLKILDAASNIYQKSPFSSTVNDHACNGGLSTCKNTVEALFDTIYNQLTSVNGDNPNPATWTQDSQTDGLTMPNFDAIVYTSIGLATSPNMVWQNRPTFQQVVEFNPGSTGNNDSFKAVSAIVLTAGALILILSFISAVRSTLRRRKKKSTLNR